jgi:hypothetical protein
MWEVIHPPFGTPFIKGDIVVLYFGSLFSLIMYSLLLTSLSWAQPSQQASPVSQPQAGSPNSNSAPSQTPPIDPQQAQADLEKLKQNPEQFRVLMLGVQIFLGRFGYGTGPFTGELDERTKEALSKYQSHVGLPITGDVDFPTIKYLTDDNKSLDQVIPFLPQALFLDEKWNDIVHVEGTWSPQSQEPLEAFQTSKITCYRKWSHCIESIAELSSDHTPQLSVQTHLYEIGSWDDKDIVSKPYLGEPCATTILRFTRETKRVSRLTSMASGKDPCTKVQNKDLHYLLINGPQIFWTLKNKKAEITKHILQVHDKP